MVPLKRGPRQGNLIELLSPADPRVLQTSLGFAVAWFISSPNDHCFFIVLRPFREAGVISLESSNQMRGENTI
jgi:hypothetical protein